MMLRAIQLSRALHARKEKPMTEPPVGKDAARLLGFVSTLRSEYSDDTYLLGKSDDLEALASRLSVMEEALRDAVAFIRDLAECDTMILAETLLAKADELAALAKLEQQEDV